MKAGQRVLDGAFVPCRPRLTPWLKPIHWARKPRGAARPAVKSTLEAVQGPFSAPMLRDPQLLSRLTTT